VSPTSKKDLARRPERLIKAGARTWHGSPISDTTLAELVADTREADHSAVPAARRAGLRSRDDDGSGPQRAQA
jgi:hypothetical protein